MSVAASYSLLGGDNCLIQRERLFRGDSTKRGFVWCHGHGATAIDGIDPATYGPIANAIVNTLGCPVLSADMGGTATWGNDTATSAMTNALAQLSAIGAKTDKIVLMGGSMGTLTSFGSILKGTITKAQVAAMVIVVGVPDLGVFHDTNRNGFAAEIETAYGGTAAYSAAIASHDPAQNPASFAGIPIRFWNGTADTTAPISDAQSFCTAVGSNASVVSVAGGAHTTTAGLIPPGDVLAFVTPYL
jgi:pimeloyl-ACP methyl ester carboxylesterase